MVFIENNRKTWANRLVLVVPMLLKQYIHKVTLCCHKLTLWGGDFWSEGFFASTVGKHGDEKIMASYSTKGLDHLGLVAGMNKVTWFNGFDYPVKR